ncbi:MAG: polyprenyl synthetase family protein [Pseudomonadota bacterium]
MSQNPADIVQRLKKRATEVERALEDALLPRAGEAAIARLQEAMAYGLTGGGKRMRPFLVIETAALFGAEGDAMAAAVALEMIHAYSLVHDDLPAMDDAETRRGKPSVHKAYDDAIAVLVGDGLLTEAFTVLSSYPAEQAAPLVKALAEAAGIHGMVGGQMMDLFPDGHGEQSILAIQAKKTGALIECAATMGCVVGRASESETAALRTYARLLGLAFQVADDLLDVTVSAEQAGKPVGRDEDMGKATFVSLLGEEGARQRLAAINDEALAALASVSRDTGVLENLLIWQANRTS